MDSEVYTCARSGPCLSENNESFVCLQDIWKIGNINCCSGSLRACRFSASCLAGIMSSFIVRNTTIICDRCVHCVEFQRLYINPRPVRGGWCNPSHEFFWAGRHTVWRIVLKFSIAYGASFAQLLVKKKWSGQVMSRSYDVMRGTTFARFQQNRE